MPKPEVPSHIRIAGCDRKEYEHGFLKSPDMTQFLSLPETSGRDSWSNGCGNTNTRLAGVWRLHSEKAYDR